MIRLENISLSFGYHMILENLSLSVRPGEHIAFMGPSGCGKTSLLRLIAGLQKPNGGSVEISAVRTACVFQEPRLLPWMTAAENIRFVLPKKAPSESADPFLHAVELRDAGQKYPHELSGGMQQRVSLARALAYDGDLLILDEPLKGLDGALHERMLTLIKEHTQEKTLLLATHSRDEANALADRVLHYQNGCFL